MLKLVLWDYRYRFLTALKVYIKMYFSVITSYILNAYVYMIILWRLDLVKYSIGMIPMLLGLALSRIFPNQLQKQMFLCPMSVRDRKKYVITAYAVRVGLACILYFGISLTALAVGRISVFEYIALSVLVIFFLLGANMHHALFNMRYAKQKGEQNYRRSIAYMVLCLFVQFIAWVTMIFLAYKGLDGQKQHADLILIVSMVGIDVVLNVAICVICYRPVIRHVMNYENNCIAGQRIQHYAGRNTQ